MSSTLKNLQKEITDTLAHQVGLQEARQMAKLLLMHHLKLSATGLIMNAELAVGNQVIALIQEQMARLLNHEPIQYVIGTAHFYGLDYNVNASVPKTLIASAEPRQEWLPVRSGPLAARGGWWLR